MTNKRGKILWHLAEALIMLSFSATLCALKADAAPVTSNINVTFEMVELMGCPRNGVKDSAKPRCQSAHEYLRYRVGYVPEKYNRTLVEKEIARAFDTCSANNTVLIILTPKLGKVDILLRFGKIDGAGKTEAHAFFPLVDNGSTTDIVFDEDELNWGIGYTAKNDFYRTAVLMIRHALSIVDSVNN